ncbi:hypothetical protein TTHERM_00471870 (macronuclear) [Tetrahymena thermophila SB210]|uniref:Uncharacterized protein n=1 Tax=Tetrahymena thermophila (strain SB210) TaxID=312017 RepID=I7MGQ9_TETTS|nr:hypothetical protein TTHERM_00471870 [Tetrahymena thermophila SB210]EAR85408.2 hypothetical protein TTHERM_00471870 [Tetrahymena thermophila SB210]|eukprot:XP_001033071.2 hypothetical protein TTHERM_00471870 [Tetrahymena thermophila SB210]
MASLQQANFMEIEENVSEQSKNEHDINSHFCLQGKIFLCSESLLGKSNCQYCILNTFTKLSHSKIDKQQNLHLNFKKNGCCDSQNMDNLIQILSNGSCPENTKIINMIQQIQSQKQYKYISEEESSSSVSGSTNASFPQQCSLSNQKSPFLSISWDNSQRNDQSISIQISSQFQQILDWNAEELQLEMHSLGMLEFSNGFNLRQPLVWLLEQFSQNNINEPNFQSQSPMFAQQLLNSKKQVVNALVQYEIANTNERFYLNVIIKQVESTLGKRYPTRQTKETNKMNVQLQTQQSISMFFNQTNLTKLENLIAQQNRVFSNDEIKFIEKYYYPNLQQSHPQLVKHNQNECSFRFI